MSASHAEQALVGAVLLDPSILGELHDLVHPADLTSEPLREVLRAAEGLRTDGEAVDLVTVTERLASRDMLPGAGGAAFVADLVARTPTAANWRSYAATVAAEARRRRAAAQLDRLRDRLDTEDADRVLLEVHEWLESATASRSAGDAWPPPLDLATLAMTEPRAPSFIVKGWLPAGAATLMSGHGGMGKSNIALHLLAAMALGLPWHGVPTRQRRVLFLAAEDRAEVLHWRLSHIARHLDVSIADLAGRLHLVDLVGRDAVLWHSACLKGGTCTPGFERLRRLMRDTGAEVLAVDGVSDTFAGSEIARAEVRAYIASLLSLIDAERGALLLLGHVDKTSANGNATSNGYSGSTAWHNSVRSRWYLYPEGGAQGTGDLLLEQQKSNHGPGGGSLRLAWDREARMFLGREVVAATAADARARNRRQQQSIIESLRSVIASGDYCPSATQGQRTAYHVLSQRAEFDHQAMPDTKAGKRLFWSHIEAMRAIGEIREGSIKREDRHTSSVLELNPARGAPAENAGNA